MLTRALTRRRFLRLAVEIMAIGGAFLASGTALLISL
jgi:hypothetical protein